MPRGQLSEIGRLRQQNTRLKNENKKLKERIVVLEKENAELKAELKDIKYELNEIKALIFKKKGKINIKDDDIPKSGRTRESYKRPIPEESEITKTIYHKLHGYEECRTREKIFYIENIPLDIKKNS